MNRTFYTDDVKLEPYWWEAAPRRRFPPVELPPKADVAIVGSGYTGLSAALALARAVAMLKGALEAQDFMKRLVENERIECHYKRPGRITGAHAPKYYDSMARDLELQRKHLGIEGEMVPRAEQHRVIGTDHY